jgi:preprotein translocase subunit SecD
MYLGLDLRGGVHFLMQVDMKAVVKKRIDTRLAEVRSLMREKNIRISGITRSDSSITVALRDKEALDIALPLLGREQADLVWAAPAPATPQGDEFKLVGTFKPEALRLVQEDALRQNIATLHNRVNELGVAEPIIQQQGLDRIVIQLPGVQDTARAKDIIGRTANLEFRMADVSAAAREALAGGAVSSDREKFTVGRGAPVVVFRDVIANGEIWTVADAQRNNSTGRERPRDSSSCGGRAGARRGRAGKHRAGHPRTSPRRSHPSRPHGRSARPSHRGRAGPTGVDGTGRSSAEGRVLR